VQAVERVLAGAQQTTVASAFGIPRSTLGRLVRRTRELGQIACVPLGTYVRKTTMHPAFQECIRRLYLLPTRLSMAAIAEHTEMHEVAACLSRQTGTIVKLPSYKQVRTEVARLKEDPDLVAVRERAKSLPRPRSSPESFVLSIPSPALLTQVDEQSLELYVVTLDGIGIAPQFVGTSVHDGLKSYDGYHFTQALCNVHHLRELTFVEEMLKQPWAKTMKELLLEMKAEVE
jgi:hypothetical protein